MPASVCRYGMQVDLDPVNSRIAIFPLSRPYPGVAPRQCDNVVEHMNKLASLRLLFSDDKKYNVTI